MRQIAPQDRGSHRPAIFDRLRPEAAVAEGETLIHDWVYENRAIYLTDLNKSGLEFS